MPLYFDNSQYRPSSLKGHRWIFILVLWLIHWCPLVAVEAAPLPLQPLTNAKEIALYPRADPKQQPPVELEAIVTFVDHTTVFLQDSTGATFLHYPDRKEKLVPGQRLHIKGRRHPGLYIGGIVPHSIQVLGSGPLPIPLQISEVNLRSGRWHYHLVEAEGIVHSFQNNGENSGILTLHSQNGNMEVRLDKIPDNAHELIDAQIRLIGLASGVVNTQRQLVSPYIRLRDPSSIKVITPAPKDPFNIKATPIADLKGSIPHRVKIKGQALSSPIYNTVYLRDETSSIVIRISAVKPPPIKPGDIVEAIGFVTAGPTRARLGNAIFRVIASGPPPQPVIPQEQSLQIKHDGDLISIHVDILQRIDEAHNTLLLCRKGPLAYTIVSRSHLPAAFAIGAKVEATGIMRVTRFAQDTHQSYASAADLMLRDDQELRLLHHAPRLNSQHLRLILGIVIAIAVISAAWAALLKIQVERQTRIIQQKVECEAITEERHRIARDFHDTLEQELAGIALCLDAAVERVNDSKAQALLSQLRKLLLRLQQETREFIWNLRESPVNSDCLPDTLTSLIHNLQEGTTIPIVFEDKSTNLSIPPHIQHQLYFIVREAVHNAIKYAKNASQITITLSNPSDELTLSIHDDGCGFNPEQIPAGHYGLLGMNERARKIHCILDVDSIPGIGTTICVRQRSLVRAS